MVVKMSELHAIRLEFYVRLQARQTTTVPGRGCKGLNVRGKVDVILEIRDNISLAVRYALYSQAGRAGALYIYSLIKEGSLCVEAEKSWRKAEVCSKL